MASVEVHPNAEHPQCFCALCTKTFPLQDDNLYRRRNLHDLCRLMEESPTPPMEPRKKDNLFVLLEDELKKRKKISLCLQCNINVGSLLRERGIAKEYESAVIRQQVHLNSDLARLQGHNLAVSQAFTAMKGTIETADDEDFKLYAVKEVDVGLRVFRERIREVARDLERFCLNAQRRQLVLQGTGNPIAMDFLQLPVQLQAAEMNPTAGPSASGLLALPPAEVNRKRAGSGSSEDEENKPPKQMKSSAAAVPPTNGGPPMPDFKERVIGRAKREENGDDVLLSVGLEPSLGCNVQYDAGRDRLSFCNVEIRINQEGRSLHCGECGKMVKQNVNKPGEFYNIEKRMKEHILHQHFKIFKFNCSRCGKGFAKKSVLEKHQCPEDKMEKQQPAAGSVQPNGKTDQGQTSTVMQVKIEPIVQEEKMEEEDEMQIFEDKADEDDDEEGEDDNTGESDNEVEENDDDIIMMD